MDVVELLEATKVEIDKRWARAASLWEYDAPAEESAACLLGCVGFARWGTDWRSSPSDRCPGYDRLRADESAGAVIELLGRHVTDPEFGSEPIKQVYLHNDVYLRTKKDAQDFVNLALADLKSS